MEKKASVKRKGNYFINFSNHPSFSWGKEQYAAAERYGKVIDLQFPNIDPFMKKEEIEALARQYCERIAQYENPTVMCQGEFCFSFAIITLLKQQGYHVVAACSNRQVEEIRQGEQTIKNVVFHFVQFREY